MQPTATPAQLFLPISQTIKQLATHLPPPFEVCKGRDTLLGRRDRLSTRLLEAAKDKVQIRLNRGTARYWKIWLYTATGANCAG